MKASELSQTSVIYTMILKDVTAYQITENRYLIGCKLVLQKLQGWTKQRCFYKVKIK